MKPIFFFDRRVEVEDVCEVLRALGKPVPTCRECEHFAMKQVTRDIITDAHGRVVHGNREGYCRFRGEVNPNMTACVKWEKRKEE